MWIELSFLVFGILVFQDIIHRYFMKLGYKSIEIVMYGLLPTVLFGILYMLYDSKKLKIPTQKEGLLFIASGIISFFTFLWIRKAQIASPNMGYVNAIIYSSVFATVVLTGLLFKDKIHIQGLLGTLFIIIGMGLIATIDHM